MSNAEPFDYGAFEQEVAESVDGTVIGLIYDQVNISVGSTNTPVGKLGVFTFYFTSSLDDVPACPPIMFLANKEIFNSLDRLIHTGVKKVTNLPDMI